MGTPVSEAWQRRFDFFTQHGSPFSKSGREAYKSLSGSERVSVMFNLWGFVFGVFYYFYLGITKRGIGIASVSFIVFMLLVHYDAGPFWIRAHAITTEVVFASLANYYYFIKVTEGRDEWDPLKDLRPA